MQKNSFTLKGEVIAGFEKSASAALTYVKNYLESSTEALELFTEDFDLIVDDIYELDIEENIDRGFIVLVEIEGTCRATESELKEFLKENTHELYNSVVGIAPTDLSVQEKNKEMHYI